VAVLKKFDVPASRSFIGAWYLEDLSLCDRLIDLHKSTPDKEPGRIGEKYIKPEKKDSTDAYFGPDTTEPAIHAYVAALNEVVQQYIAEFSYCNFYSPWRIIQAINIQHYKPGGGFKTYHTERFSRHEPNTSRHLVFMTYLNDVDDGGGTEFFYQKTVTPARKGLTVIWPADWTHTHRGVVSPTEEKYIITGWFNFI
jgi:prolyl 4-hydroxylase